jgi:transcription elongation factor GreA
MFLNHNRVIPAKAGQHHERLRHAATAVGAHLPVTAAARQAFERELEKLRAAKERELPERLRVARQYGDGANNDEYLAIREEEAVLDARLTRLENILTRTRVVELADSADTIAIGSSVTVMDVQSGQAVHYVIDSAHAPLAPGAVSAVSPVGIALLGRGVGDVVNAQLPTGRTRELEVLAIRPSAPP